MKLSRAVLGCVYLPLLAACDHNVYVGRDAPMALRELATDAAMVWPDEPATEALDSGVVHVQTLPVMPQMQPEPMQATAPICDARHADCDLDVNNGCEVDLMHARDHCGACSIACQTPDCSCNEGKLILNCADKHADCDADIRNGCEADLGTSMSHCGACQRACHTNGHDVTSAMCVAGRCEVTCEPRISPEEDCDGNPDNGCETYLLFDPKNCGACGNSCVTNCEAGTCML